MCCDALSGTDIKMKIKTKEEMIVIKYTNTEKEHNSIESVAALALNQQ